MLQNRNKLACLGNNAQRLQNDVCNVCCAVVTGVRPWH